MVQKGINAMNKHCPKQSTKLVSCSWSIDGYYHHPGDATVELELLRCHRRGSLGPLQPISVDLQLRSRASAIDNRRNFFLFLFWIVQHCRRGCSTPHLACFNLQGARMKLSNQSEVPVYTISGSNTARPLPEWLAKRRKRSLKNDPEYANRIELLQDFEFEEASQCIRVSEDGEWVMSTG